MKSLIRISKLLVATRGQWKLRMCLTSSVEKFLHPFPFESVMRCKRRSILVIMQFYYTILLVLVLFFCSLVCYRSLTSALWTRRCNLCLRPLLLITDLGQKWLNYCDCFLWLSNFTLSCCVIFKRSDSSVVWFFCVFKCQKIIWIGLLLLGDLCRFHRTSQGL